MIRLTRFNHSELVVNSDVIAYLEATPDTLVTLTNGERIHVLERVEEVVERALAYQRRVHE
jgi:flagellar protein FlbD